MENNNRNGNKTQAYLVAGLCFILLLPIIILPPGLQTFDWSRTILFRIITTLLVCFLAFRHLYKKDFSFSIPKWSFSVYLPFLLLSGFIFTLILATLFSEDVRFSVFGSPSRAGGVLNYIFYFIFVVLLSIFIKENDWKKLFKTILAAGLAGSLLAFIQYFKILKNILVSYETAGVPSFFGNSTFLAIFMLFLVFFSFALFILEKNRKIKIIYFCLLLSFLFSILTTGARAVYVAVAVSFLYFILFYPVRKLPLQHILNRKLNILKGAVVTFLILIIVVVVYVNISPTLPSFVENNAKLSHLARNRLSVKLVLRDLLDIRLSTWKITLDAIKEKPIFGWGPENFYIGFEKYNDPNLFNISQQWWVQQRWWDRPHNIFLDVAVNSGVISAVFYSLFWIALFYRLGKSKNLQKKSPAFNKNHMVMAHAIQAMLIGYFIALFFNFDIFPTYLMSFFFAGYSFYLMSEGLDKKVVLPPKTNLFKNKFIYIPALLVLISFLWFWGFKPLYYGEKIVYSLNLADNKKCGDALLLLEQVWQKNSILGDYAGLKYADTAKKCGSLENEIPYSLKSLEALKISSKLRPKFTGTWLLMGSFTNILAAREQNQENKNKLLLEAKIYLEKAKELSPKKQGVIFEMEKNYLIASDYQAMAKLGEDCVKIDANASECHWYLGLAEIFLGEQEKGKKHIQDSREKNPYSPYWVQLGIAYISQKNYEDAAEAYRKAIRYNDWKNPGYHAVLAYLYKQLGDYENSGKEAMEVFGLQPENKEVPEFLRLLLGFEPNDPTLHSSLAYVYTQTGQAEKGRREYLIVKSIYSNVVAKYPKNPSARMNLARVLKELKEYDLAYEQALTAEKLNKEYHDGTVMFIRSIPEGNYWGKYLLSGGKE